MGFIPTAFRRVDERGSVVLDRWEELYDTRDYDRCAYLDGEAMVDHVEAFLEYTGVPSTIASVGCGPAVTEFAIADRYPGIDVACFDAVEQMVVDNRGIASKRGIENISFEVATLPDIDLGRRFEHVYCLATLYFVADVERALERLSDHVADGGSLVVSLPDEDLRSWVREQDEYKRSFFELVERGENLLSPGDVEAILDRPVEDFWDLVDAGGHQGTTVVVEREPAV